MSRRLTIIAISLLLVAGVAIPAEASLPPSFWNPPLTAGVRSPSCDRAFGHKQAVRVPPGENLSLGLTLPGGVSVANVTLYYRFNQGSTQSLTSALASFVLPGGSLTEGTTLDYSFTINTPTGGPCLGASAAVVPERNGFHSVATAKTGFLESPIWESRTYAMAVMHGQPRFAGQNSPYGACDTYFKSPTPCTQADGSLLESGSLPAGSDVVRHYHKVTAENPAPPGADKYCDVYAPENWNAVLYEPEMTTSGFELALGATDVTGSSASTGTTRMRAALSTVGFSGGMLTWKSDTGFLVRFNAAAGTTPSSFPVAVNLNWRQSGRRAAFVASGAAAQTASGTPASTLQAVRGTVDASAQRLTESVEPEHASFGSNGVSVASGPSLDGLGSGTDPYEAAKEISGPDLSWELSLSDDTRYGFWVRTNMNLTVDAQAGGATVDLDNSNPALDYGIRSNHIRFEATDNTVFTDC